MFHPNQQLRLLEQGFDPAAMLRQSLLKGVPWNSIIEFATDPRYCGQGLYPRQQTLLRLIYLEVENMTQYDFEVINLWRQGFVAAGIVCGVQPDIWERVEYLRRRGYRRFPHVQAVLGRRASKGFIGAIIAAESIAYLIAMDNPQRCYSIREGKDCFLNVGATSQTQAQRHQYADIRDVVENCAWLQPYIAETKDHQMRMRTPADLRKIAEMKALGVPIEHTIASLWVVALSASSVAGRGATSYCLDPMTPVLTADLRWVPINSVMPGDAVVGIDEFPGRAKGSSRNGQRKLRRAIVLAKATTIKKAYRLTFDNGRSLVCSADHRWLVRRSRGPLDWRVTRGPSEFHSLKVGHQIVQVVEPWEEDDSREAGYLAGIFDGEGSLNRGGARGPGSSGLSVFVSQNPGVVLEHIMSLLKEKGFTPQPSNPPSYLHDGGCEQWAIRGIAESLRFLGQIRPERLVARSSAAFEGVSLRGKGATRYKQPPNVVTIVEIEELPEQQLVDIQTSTNTFVANGLVSHNCNMFDEFAFHVQGSGSVKSGEEIYEDWQPSLGQFKKNAFTYVPSSPFCLAPETRVLTEDLRWVPVGSLVVGDKLIGFDEQHGGAKGKGRCWRQTEVTETSVIYAPRYKITMESGKELVSTSEHMWLARRSQYDYEWFKTSKLKPGDKIKTLGVDPWGTDDSREAGYLAGFFDGEGYLSGAVNRLLTLGYSQNSGPVNDHVKTLMAKAGYNLKDYTPDQKLAKMRVQGGVAEVMRFLGQVRPERLLPKFHERFYGSRIYGRANPAVDIVVSVEYLDDGEVIALGTSTSTLVAEGLLSHNTKVGKFYELYNSGRVLMASHQDAGDLDLSKVARAEIHNLRMRADLDAVELHAEPTMLILQGPSWMLYEDWERGEELTGFQAPFAPENDLRDEEQQRRQIRNPEKFAVERLGQFAEVMGQYLDRIKVDAMLRPVPWRDPPALVPTPFGRFDYTYRIHCDPSKTGANFALAIGHTEIAPCDRCGAPSASTEADYCAQCHEGMCWPHVMLDRLQVWRAIDFDKNPDTGKHEVDYTIVERELDDILYTFPSTTRFSSDQWNSVGFLQRLRKKYLSTIRVSEETATEGTNWARAEKFKSALNLGWVHTYDDKLADEGLGETSLLGLECKFLSEKNGKVFKQEFGPVQTKDLYDCVSVIVNDLLHDALERWETRRLTAHAYGSSNAAGLRSGREFERAAAASGSVYAGGHRGSGNKAWESLDNYQLARRRGKQRDAAYFPTHGARAPGRKY